MSYIAYIRHKIWIILKNKYVNLKNTTEIMTENMNLVEATEQYLLNILTEDQLDELIINLNKKKQKKRKIPDMEDRCCARQWQGTKEKKHSTLLQCTRKKIDGNDYCNFHMKPKHCKICESGCKKVGGVSHDHNYQCFGTINQRIIDIGKDEGNPERGYHLICLLHKNIENGVEYDLEDEIKEQYDEVPIDFILKSKIKK